MDSLTPAPCTVDQGTPDAQAGIGSPYDLPQATTTAPRQTHTPDHVSQLADHTPAPGTNLSPAMRLFAEQLAIGTGKATAYKQAYPRSDQERASRDGGKLSRDPRVLRYVDHLRKTGFESADLSMEDITKALSNIAMFDYSTICHKNGKVKPVDQWPKGAGLVIDGISARGEPKIPDRLATLRTLAEIQGGLGKRQEAKKQLPATFVFNFGAKKKPRPEPKVVHGEVVHDQDEAANIGQVPARLVDRECSE